MRGHANDPAAQVHEVLAHDKAFSAVLEFLEKDTTEGVLVSTSDHETGGLAAARQIHVEYPRYRWYPEVLANASHSAEWLSLEYAQYLNREGAKANRLQKRTFLRTNMMQDGLGIQDSTDDELDAIIDAKPIWPASYHFADLISKRAEVGWSTHGHSGKSLFREWIFSSLTKNLPAVDVNIYASDPAHAPTLVGNHENTEVGKFLAEYLDVDLKPITEKLKRKGVDSGAATAFSEDITASGSDWNGWMGPPGLPINENGNLIHLDTYHGDLSHRKREAKAVCGCGFEH